MKVLKKIFSLTAAAVMCLLMCSCDRSDSDSSTDILKNGAESIVPSRAELIDNTKDAGYTVTEFDDIYDLKVSGERVLAEKDGKFINMCYGLSEDDEKRYTGIMRQNTILSSNPGSITCFHAIKTLSILLVTNPHLRLADSKALITTANSIFTKNNAFIEAD